MCDNKYYVLFIQHFLEAFNFTTDKQVLTYGWLQSFEEKGKDGKFLFLE